MIGAKAKELRKGEGTAGPLDSSRVVPLFPRVQTRPLIAPPSGPATRQSRGLSRPLLVTALLSLAAHGGALAAFFGWSEGPRIEAGAPFVVEVVAFSAAGGGESSPAEAGSNAAPRAAPQPPQRSQAPARPQQPQDAELPAPQPRPLPVTVPSQQVATPPVAAVAEPVPAPVPAPEPESARQSAKEPVKEPVRQTAELATADSPAPVEAPVAPPPEAATPPAVSPPPVKPSIPQQAALPPAASLPPASAPQGTNAGASASSGSSNLGGGAGSRTGASRAASPAAGNAPPDYPLIARRRGQEGLVVVLVALSPAGLPERIALAEASGVASLDEAALEAVRGWRFTPATENGRAVASELRVPIRFRLEQ